ncbi:MAG: hypothetical protein IAG10_08860, partial [Planctomycetaceae bacterium]|nr:hypothetical protein [Planctomycetaceae bacterium]
RQGLPTGRELLSDVAKLSNGRERTDILSVLADPPRSVQTRSLLPWLFAFSIVVLLLEIAGRRLNWWESFPWWRRATAAVKPAVEVQHAPTASPSWWESFRPARARRHVTPAPVTAAALPTTTVPGSTAPPTPAPKPISAADLFDQAKRRAANRLK